MVYSSLALAILASIGFVELGSVLLKPSIAATVKKKKIRPYETRVEVKIVYSIFMIMLIALPVTYPPNANWISVADIPVALANGGTSFRTTMPDWIEALSWMRENTPQYQLDGKPTVIASWWDYGYWITVMGNRTSLADNATMNQTRIAQIGRMFMSDEKEGWIILKDLKADYVLVYIAGQKFADPSTGQLIYLLGGGGDESKKQWFIKIGGLNISKYLYEDEFTPTPYFWDNTLLGKMFPFRLIQYVDQTGRFAGVEWQRGYQGVYIYSEQYPITGEGPMRLVFKSSSLIKPLASGERSGVFAAVLIYEVVKDWKG